MKLSLRGRETAFLALIQGVISYEWIKSGWEKLTDSAYIPGMTKTISTFAGKNPFHWFADFLAGTVQPHAQGFGYLVMWGELLAGVGLAVGAVVMLFKTSKVIYEAALAVTVAAALGGLLLNLSFWFAAGWLSPSTDGINLVMGLTQVALGGAAIMSLRAMRHSETKTVPVTPSVTQLRSAAAHR